ncbi:MAG: hypothetical protein EOM12_08280 [Verrucomicrobiae bacterium]|nr:hypothetical protein [Verrucomicrobiae bacterium]
MKLFFIKKYIKSIAIFLSSFIVLFSGFYVNIDKVLFKKKYIKPIVIFLFSFIILLFGFAIYIDSGLKRAYSIGEFTLKLEDTNQTNHLVTPEVIERGLKIALLSCQLEPKHWAVDDVDVYGSGLTNWNDWNDIVQVTNNARVYLRLINTVLKESSPPSVDNKKNVLYCTIIFLDDDHALNYDLNWLK